MAVETGELPPPPLHFLKVSTFYLCECKGMVTHTQGPVLTSTLFEADSLVHCCVRPSSSPTASKGYPYLCHPCPTGALGLQKRALQYQTCDRSSGTLNPGSCAYVASGAPTEPSVSPAPLSSRVSSEWLVWAASQHGNLRKSQSLDTRWPSLERF